MAENIDGQASTDEKQIDACVDLANYLTSRYPQVDNMRKMTIEANEGVFVELPELPENIQIEPQLNYYLTGSLAIILLSRAETIDLCEETNWSNIRVVRSVTNPKSTRVALAEFARPIGDVDYVPTAHYTELQRRVQDSFGKISSEEYQQLRERYLWKGGSGPKFGELSANVTYAFKKQKNWNDNYRIMCDPVESYGTKKFARINIEGQDYYIARPDTIIGYKILQILQNYDQKPHKFNSDFAKLHQALIGLYTEDELVNLTHHILSEYEKSNPIKPHELKLAKMTQDLLGKHNLGQKTRSFVEKIIEYDQDHGHIFRSQ